MGDNQKVEKTEDRDDKWGVGGGGIYDTAYGIDPERKQGGR